MQSAKGQVRDVVPKPPPPVPPRPSKELVAEALLKTRNFTSIHSIVNLKNIKNAIVDKEKSSVVNNNRIKPRVPIRPAPPPPQRKELTSLPDLSEKGDDYNSVETVSSFKSLTLERSEVRLDVNKVCEKGNEIRVEELSSPDQVEKSVVICKENKSSVESDSGLEQSTSNSCENWIDSYQTNNTSNSDCSKSYDSDNFINDLLLENYEQHNSLHVDDLNNSPNKLDAVNNSTKDRHALLNDNINHEILIAELQNMRRDQERLLKRQRKPSIDKYELGNSFVNGNNLIQKPNIQRSDWFELGDNGNKVQFSSCQITIDESNRSNDDDSCDSIVYRIKEKQKSGEMSLHGLPPLPKSLSGFSFSERCTMESCLPPAKASRAPNLSTQVSPGSSLPVPGCETTSSTPGSGSSSKSGNLNGDTFSSRSSVGSSRKFLTLDAQLAVLRREMFDLRQLDLSLLSQLWSLNESIQDFRQILQEQEESGALSPPSPSPSPSTDGDDADEFYSPALPARFRPAPPPPPLRRTSNSSSATSSEHGNA